MLASLSLAPAAVLACGQDAQTAAADTGPSAAADVRITEVLPNPVGSDAAGEFIELFNAGEARVDLTGWQLIDAKGRSFHLDGTDIDAGAYLALPYSSTAIPLANDGTTVTLDDAGGGAADVVSYAGTAPEGQAYALDRDGNWRWTSDPTPGAANAFPDIAPTGTAAGDTSPREASTGTSAIAASDTVRVNEFMPDPAGSDDAEWIEIADVGTAGADVSGWSVDDAEGGSSPYDLPPGTVVPPAGVLLLRRSATKIALNNDGDHVRLFRPDGTMVDDVAYDKAVEGESYALIGGSWTWSAVPTPGLPNPVSVATGPSDAAANVTDVTTTAAGDTTTSATDGSADQATETAANEAKNGAGADQTTATDPIDMEDPGTGPTGTPADGASPENAVTTGTDGPATGTGCQSGTATSSGTSADNGPDTSSARTVLPIGGLDALDDGTTATINGVVTFAPGDIGKTMIGLQDGASSVIVRTYGDLPDGIRSGAELHVTGKVARTEGVVRLNAKADDVTVTGQGAAVPVDRAIAEIGRDDEGLTVHVTGTVTDVRTHWFMMTDDGARTELKVQAEPSALPTAVTGTKIDVTGTVRYLGDQASVIPGSDGDVTVVSAPTTGAGTTSAADDTGNTNVSENVNAGKTLVMSSKEGPGGTLPAAGILGLSLVGASTIAIRRKKKGVPTP